MRKLFRLQIIFTALIAGLSSTAFSAGNYNYNYTPRNYASNSYGGSATRNYLSAALGFLAPGMNTVVGTANGTQTAVNFTNSGLFALGADYDYMYKNDVSFGGFFRYYSVSTTIADTQYKNTLFSIGPSVRGYWQTDSWTGIIGTGFGFIAPGYNQTRNVSVDVSVNTTIGWMLSLQWLYRFSDTFSLGFENMKIIGLSSSVNGVLVDDYMFKGRFAL
jgi:hypothetical protein